MAASLTLSALVAHSAQQLETAHAAGQLSFGQGTTNADDEAAWLVLWRLGLPLDTDVSDPASDAPLSPEQIEHVQALIQHRIDPWLPPHTTRVLDLCTGNGSLGILAALAFPDITVVGLDLSQDALDVARINIERHGLQARMTLAVSDGLHQAEGMFDLILCNPPYVNSQSMASLPAEFKAEPALALAGGDDGMDFIRQLLRDAPAHMSEHAVLVLEIGHERDYFEAAFPHLDVVWLSTSAGDDQVLLLTHTALTQGALPQ